MRSTEFASLLLSSCVLLRTVDANPNGLGRLPPRGWNTWCTQGSCHQDFIKRSPLHDNCSEALVKDVASAMISNGMLAAGWEHINMDDCNRRILSLHLG